MVRTVATSGAPMRVVRPACEASNRPCSSPYSGAISAAEYIPAASTLRREGSMSARPRSIVPETGSASASGSAAPDARPKPASCEVTGRPSRRDRTSSTTGRTWRRGTVPPSQCDTADSS
jgi:hypothetical protein